MDVHEILNNEELSIDHKKSLLYDNKYLIDLNNINEVGGFYKKYNASKSLKIGFLRSYSIETMLPFLETFLRVDGFEPSISLGGYNQFQQEMLDEKSMIYDDNYDLIFLAMRLEELSIDLTEKFILLSETDLNKEIENVVNRIMELLSVIRNKMNTPIILNNFIIPWRGKYGILESNYLNGQKEILRILNTRVLKSICSSFKSVYLLDIDGLASKVGQKYFFDHRMYHIAKVPYSGKALIEICREFSKITKIILGKRKKCIVLDCDNTLWGGIVGEDGLDGIQLGEEYPGICYKNFQRVLLDYSRKGIMLAINSKNNYNDVLQVLEKHPHQVLKKENFAIMKISWGQKNLALREIVETLNIGLDSCIFIDDNPVECKMIKDSYPEVQVVNLPENPLEIENILENIDDLEMLSFTLEDKQKTKQYLDNVKRERLKKDTFNLQDFYLSLDMKMDIKKDHEPSVERLAQISQKTNQFNLTTKRYSEADIINYFDYQNSIVYSFSLKDKFGDNGVVGLSIVCLENEVAVIDAFLMSCRVISRTAENNFLNYILGDLSRTGYKTVFGVWEKTKKNVLVENFYDLFGFELIEKSDINKNYRISIINYKPQYDKWMKIEGDKK